MWRCTCLPRTVSDFLYPFKPLFRCSQARHFVIFSWLLVAIMRDPGAGTLNGRCPYLPPHLSYWALIRMLRSGTWEAQAGMNGRADQVLRSLPPAADGKLSLIGDTTPKPKRGKKHPWGHVTRQNKSSPHVFGFGMGGWWPVGMEFAFRSRLPPSIPSTRDIKISCSVRCSGTLKRRRGCETSSGSAMPVMRPTPPSS
jgi:hypothetical protein